MTLMAFWGEVLENSASSSRMRGTSWKVQSNLDSHFRGNDAGGVTYIRVGNTGNYDN